MTRPCSDCGSQGPLATEVGTKASWSAGEEGCFAHGARPWRNSLLCHQSAKRTIQYAGHIVVSNLRTTGCPLARDDSLTARAIPRALLRRLDVAPSPPAPRSLAVEQLRQRPDRGAAHQRARIVEQPLGRRRKVASPELPIAISTLRMKRSRPMRLTGDFENNARKAASSSRARSASSGARKASRAASLVSRPAWANLFQGQTARQSSQP